MKIDHITTIVDLAFNLSGSLAGIPVILPQLPVGERVGFSTLPEVWEDVSDVGQTWTPNLDGVEVDIAVEAYNPTAIQKAPYSSDMRRIDVASSWGNALLDVLESGDWYNILDVPSNAVYIDKARIINLNEPVNLAVVDESATIWLYDFARPAGANVVAYSGFAPRGSAVQVWLGFSTINLRLYQGIFTSMTEDNTALLQPLQGSANIWEVGDTTLDWLDKDIEISVTRVRKNSDTTVFQAPYSTGWALERNVFIKALPDTPLWYDSLERGGISTETGQTVEDNNSRRTKFFSKAKSDTFELISTSPSAGGALYCYSDTFEYLDYWSIRAGETRTVTTEGTAYFKVVIYGDAPATDIIINPVY